MKRSGPPKRNKPLARKPFAGKPSSERPPEAHDVPGADKAGSRPSGLNRRAKRRRKPEPGEDFWKLRRYGTCKACVRYGRIVFHHLVDEQTIRKWTTAELQADGICWDLRNALEICAPLSWGGRGACHDGHHHYGVNDTRLPFTKVSPSAREFAVEIMGAAAVDYWRRRYRDAPD